MARAARTPDEQDAFTRWRRVLAWRRGELRRIKRQAAKRDRREGRAEVEREVERQ